MELDKDTNMNRIIIDINRFIHIYIYIEVMYIINKINVIFIKILVK